MRSNAGGKKIARLGVASLLLSLTATQVRAEDVPIPPQVQGAVDRGLEWLAHNQDPRTGEWDTPGMGGSATAAVTSLAAMAFMARGHVPGQGPYGDNINKAVDYVISIQRADGLLCADAQQSNPMYDHGICTVMLCEAYGMLDERRQKAALNAIDNAVRLILKAQSIRKDRGNAGGWRYLPTSGDSDISVTGWQMMALRGAGNIGANIPPSAIAAGINYIKMCAESNGAFRYGNGRADAALTGTGIVALELMGEHQSKEAIAGGNYLRNRNRDKGAGFEFYYYTVYYCAQAAWQLGGRYWDEINPPIRESLLQKQRRDGAWTTAGSNEGQGGEVYGTSMAILALTVPYRYLPIYQK